MNQFRDERKIVRASGFLACSLCVLLGMAAAVNAADSNATPTSWIGEWTWSATDQVGTKHGGSLSIRDCDARGCSYSLATGNEHSVCQSDGHFSFASPTRGVDKLKTKDYKGKNITCRISLERRNSRKIETDATGKGCSYYCGRSANFGGVFTRVSTSVTSKAVRLR